MDIAQQLPIFIIIALVLIVFPAILAKKSGKNPMEMIFGSRVNNTIFGKRTEAGDDSVKKKTPIQTNSSQNDLLQMISSLISFSRRNHYYILSPGTVVYGGQTATLAAILITRSAVIGINCFGYGGTITARKNDADWKQVLNGEEKEIPNPVKKNRKQKEILSGALKECGYPEISVEVLGVFTASSLELKQAAGTGCYKKQELMNYLRLDRMMQDKKMDVKEIGKALEKTVQRTK